jgi:hypothetical protein
LKFKFDVIKKALDELERSAVGYDPKRLKDIELDISMCEEDPGKGQLIECVQIKCVTVSPATTYSREKEVTHTIEVFSSSENRPTRLHKTETYEVMSSEDRPIF